MLVDSHCHLDRLSLEYCGGSLDAAMQAACERGVGAMLCVCISEENKNDVLTIARRYPNVYASVGVHPSDVMDEVISSETLQHWAEPPEVVALGETGLDYHYSPDSAVIQQESFREHLRAAGSLGLPVIVHTREAREDTLRLIKEHGNPEAAGVLHCFTEDWDMARRAMDMNYCISISGIITFRSAGELREVVRKTPLDRLLVETDSPYLAPIPYRGKPNQPAYVREVAACVADIKNISLERLAEATTENFYRLFNRAIQPV